MPPEEKKKVILRCPNCGTEPLEVFGLITRDFNGTFDEEGDLTTETTYEEITHINCISCKVALPLALIKNWT